MSNHGPRWVEETLSRHAKESSAMVTGKPTLPLRNGGDEPPTLLRPIHIIRLSQNVSQNTVRLEKHNRASQLFGGKELVKKGRKIDEEEEEEEKEEPEKDEDNAHEGDCTRLVPKRKQWQ